MTPWGDERCKVPCAVAGGGQVTFEGHRPVVGRRFRGRYSLVPKGAGIHKALQGRGVFAQGASRLRELLSLRGVKSDP